MVSPIFTPDFFSSNRAKLKAMITPNTPVIITANGLLQRGADSSYPFSQDSNFWYLSGISDPDIVMVIDAEGKEFLIVPIREGSRVVFDGQIDVGSLSEVSGITEIVNETSGWKRLDAILEKSKKLATLAAAPPFIEQFGIYSNPSRAHLLDRLRRHVKDLEIEDIRPQLVDLRMIKQSVELEAIKTAIDITVETLKNVLSAPYGTYKNEYEIEADITHGFRHRGADGHAFEPIVAGGVRACTMHNINNNFNLTRGELVILDVGSAVSGYASDITRVYSTDKPTTRQKEVFRAVKETQEYAISLLKPRVSLRTYEHQVTKFIGRKLKDLKIIDKINENNIRRYFPHATSHFLGLNVHDVGNYMKPLREGMVITVEPGIYIPEEGIGVRIEDDILITNDGAKVLSASLPTKL